MRKKLLINCRGNISLLIIVLVAIGAFLAGSAWGKKSAVKDKVAGAKTEDGSLVFSPEESKKPNIKFFVMSFCPFGNQAETGLKPVADLLGDKVEWEPHYIVNKSTEQQFEQMCQAEIYSEELCQNYIDQGYFPDLDSCKQRLYSTEEECFEAKSGDCLATSDGSYYCSLHGKKELNQDIREICAWNLTDDKSKWWQFISLVNANCQLEEIDQCWQEQAEKAGIDKDKVQDCFNKNAIETLDKEIAVTEEFAVSGSPSVFVNNTAYPPEEAYDQEGKATVTIDKTTFKQEEYRSPEAFKQAICVAFSKTPKECKTELSREANMGSGSCN